MTEFINREDELERLNRLYNSNEPELAVVYGKRRIGKTALVTESVKDRGKFVYYQAVETTKKDQLEDFIETASENYPGIKNIKRDWEAALRYLVDEDAIIIIDEFPYLVDEEESLPSKIQRLWDHETEGTEAKLVLTGSSIGMIYETVLEGGAPLYGRVSQRPNGEFSLDPFNFGDATKFFPSYSNEKKVLAYGIFGGTPKYLQTVDPDRKLEENVKETLLKTEGALQNEPETVLRMELDEVNRYFAVLKSIAEGNRKQKRIIDSTGIPQSSAGYYLDRLEKLQIIEKEHPVTEEPRKSRNTRYKIRDNLFRFWFRFIYGQETRYEVYDKNPYRDLIEPKLPHFVSPVFEELCSEATLKLHSDLTFMKKPGRWWRKGREIDIVGITDSNKLLVGEAKFTSKPLGYKTLAKLEEDAKHITQKENSFRYVLFSRSGFKKSVKEEAEQRENLYLHGIDEVVDMLENK